MPSLQLEAFGVIGIFMEIGAKLKEQAVRTESIFSMAQVYVDQAKYLDDVKHYVGMGLLALLLFVTLLIVPILQLITLVFLWIFPISEKRRQKLAIFLEILQAWQYVEVYILGIVIMSWQLGSVSKLFINRYCGSINGILVQLAYYGIIGERDAQCFEMEASIAAGAYLLVPFVSGLAVINTFVVKAYVQYLREKKHEEDQVTEEEKLRAFDRTTWDNRNDALDNIRPAPVLFTDTFRWSLKVVPNTGKEVNKLAEESDDGTHPMTAEATYVVPETSSSDEENVAAHTRVQNDDEGSGYSEDAALSQVTDYLASTEDERSHTYGASTDC